MNVIFIVISMAILGWAIFVLFPAIPASLALSPAPGVDDGEAHGWKRFLETWTGEPKATPLPPNPLSADQQATDSDAAELIKKFRTSLVFVSNQDAAGSGFLARYANGNYLFTNAHVAAEVKGAAFKTLAGESVQTGPTSVAVGHDIFLMQAAANGEPFEIMKAGDQEAAVGDPVAIYGNSGGAGVIAAVTGKILGIGPNVIEIDAPFAPGDSGSPIVHLKTGKVIGVATYLLVRKIDPTTKQPLGTPQIRRFGYRLDSVKAWQPVNWVTFAAQAQEMEKIDALTGDLTEFLREISITHHIHSPQHVNPVIQSRIDAFEAQAQLHPLMSDQDKANVARDFVISLQAACQTDVSIAQQNLTYDYFQRRLAEKQRDRTALAETFGRVMEDALRFPRSINWVAKPLHDIQTSFFH